MRPVESCLFVTTADRLPCVIVENSVTITPRCSALIYSINPFENCYPLFGYQLVSCQVSDRLHFGDQAGFAFFTDCLSAILPPHLNCERRVSD